MRELRTFVNADGTTEEIEIEPAALRVVRMLKRGEVVYESRWYKSEAEAKVTQLYVEVGADKIALAHYRRGVYQRTGRIS